MSISRKQWEQAKNAQVWSLCRLIFAIELDHFSVTFPLIFKVKLSNWLFRQVNAQKMQTLLLPSDWKSGICNQMVPLRMLFIMTLFYIVKVTTFEMSISRKRWELTKIAQVWLLYRLIFIIEWDHCEYRTPRLWPNFQGQIFQMQISLKWLANHASHGFYRIWYLPLNGAIFNVVFCDVSLLFQGQIFQMLIYRKPCELHIFVKYYFYRRLYLPSKLNHY